MVDANRQLKQSHKFSVAEALAALRFKNLVTYEPRIKSNSKCMDHFDAQPYVFYSVLSYSTLFCSYVHYTFGKNISLSNSRVKN